MRKWAAVPLLGVGACGGVGLTDYETGGSTVELVVVPKGTTDFGEVSPYGDPVVETFTMSTKGDERTSIVDVYLDGTTSTAFSLAASSLTYPRPLQAGTSLAVDVEFLPNAPTSYTGTLVIEYESDAAGTVTEVRRMLIGEKCSDSNLDGHCD